MKRRDFVKASAWTATLAGFLSRDPAYAGPVAPRREGPVVLSTWPHGLPANRVAWELLAKGGSPMDAAEAGVRVPEGDPEVTSVGYGGHPNEEGVVELDAAIISGADLECGSVASLQGIRHPITVARWVKERTRHVMLVGEGAKRFALAQGAKEEELLSPGARAAWEAWKASSDRRVPGQVEDHDTIGLICRSAAGKMAAACTTSGLSWKIPGRVGDSPLIGHGLYCDDQAGGACATGIGEEVIKVCGSYQVVEFMRQGLDPKEAVRRVLQRVVRRDPKNAERIVGFVAVRADGAYGFGATTKGFEVAVSVGGEHRLMEAPVMG